MIPFQGQHFAQYFFRSLFLGPALPLEPSDPFGRLTKSILKQSLYGRFCFTHHLYLLHKS
jgi:hypothetical protein